MKEFEKLLLAEGSRLLILAYVRIYEAETSQEFKDYVATHFPDLCDKEELLEMNVKDFFKMYGRDEKQSMVNHLFNIFYAYDIEKVSDLLGVGALNFLRFRTAGAKTIACIKRVCVNAGVEFK